MGFLGGWFFVVVGTLKWLFAIKCINIRLSEFPLLHKITPQKLHCWSLRHSQSSNLALTTQGMVCWSVGHALCPSISFDNGVFWCLIADSGGNFANSTDIKFHSWSILYFSFHLYASNEFVNIRTTTWNKSLKNPHFRSLSQKYCGTLYQCSPFQSFIQQGRLIGTWDSIYLNMTGLLWIPLMLDAATRGIHPTPVEYAGLPCE